MKRMSYLFCRPEYWLNDNEPFFETDTPNSFNILFHFLFNFEC